MPNQNKWINGLAVDICTLMRQYDAVPRFLDMLQKYTARQKEEHAGQAGTIELPFIVKAASKPLPLPRNPKLGLDLVDQYACMWAIYEHERKGTGKVGPDVPDGDIWDKWDPDGKACMILQSLVDEIPKLNPDDEQWLRFHLEDVKKDIVEWRGLPAEEPAAGTHSTISKSAKKASPRPTTKTATENKFMEWKSPGDAFFVVDKERIKFHYKGETKDLKLKRDSKTEKLLKMLIKCNVAGNIIKEHLCTTKTKPSKLKQQANKLLNEKLRKVGFLGVPDNTEFVRFNSSCNQYELTLPGFPSTSKLEEWYSEHSAELVDDRWMKRLQDDEGSF